MIGAVIMKQHRLKSDANLGVVIAFRPQMEISCRDRLWNAPVYDDVPDYSPIPGIEKYERLDRDDDYRHRMKMNAIAAVVVSVLVLVGVWLADLMAHA
jgi:hypothetical protein